MKKNWKKITVLSIVLMSMMMWTNAWSQNMVDTITASPTQTVSYNICESQYTQVILYKPSWAYSGTCSWEQLPDEYWQDSIIITASNQGYWVFHSPQGNVGINVNFVSSPTEHPSMIQDTSFCTTSFSLMLDAGNPYATYLWSTGATTQTITATTPGYHWVVVTNTCGVDTFDITITQSNPNAPDLGSNQSFCWGSSSVLDPGSTNVASYQWSTGETTPTITVDTTGTYWVYLIDNNGCSGRDTIEIEALLPISEEICYVEFDTVTWKNNVNWTSTLPGNADSVRIYKEDGINWIPIGTVYKTTTNFLDIASNPQAQSYSYKIAVIDTCGNESDLSSYHKTITLLSAYDQPSNTYGFTWSHYEGLIVSYYYLYGIDASNNVHLVATVNGSVQMYNYVGPNPAYIKYYVGFETPNCDGTKANVIVKSNWIIKDPLITGTEEVNYVPFSIYPTPANDQLNLSIEANDFQVEVLTLLGQVVLTEHNAKILDVSNLTKGTYIISISVDGIRNNKVFTKH